MELVETTGSMSRREMFRLTMILVVVLASLVVFSGIQHRLSAGLFLVVGSLFALLLSWRLETVALLQFVYITLIPIPYVGQNFPVIPFYFNYFSNFPAVIAMMGVLIIHKLHHRVSGPLIRRDMTGLFVGLFLAMTVFEMIRGFAQNYRFDFMLNLTAYIVLYFIYFFFRDYFVMKNNHYSWLKYMTLYGLVVSLFYFFLVYTVFTDIFSFVIYREITHHSYYALASVPLGLGYFALGKTTRQKVLWFLLVSVFMVQVILGQQRAVWLAIVVVGFTFITLYFFKDSVSLGRIIKYFLVLLSFSALMFLLLITVSSLLKVDLSVLFTRWQGLKQLKDPSIAMRIYDSKRAIALVGDNWLTGMGMGAVVRSSPRGMQSFFFDQSYMLTYFIGGIPYVGLLALIYLSALWNTLVVIYRSKDRRRKILSIAIASSFVGQLVAAMTDLTIYMFGFMFVWIILLSVSTILRVETEEEISGEREAVNALRTNE